MHFMAYFKVSVIIGIIKMHFTETENIILGIVKQIIFNFPIFFSITCSLCEAPGQADKLGNVISLCVLLCSSKILGGISYQII